MNLLKGILIFLLLWEWLKPLPLIANFSNINVFVFALALFAATEVTIMDRRYKLLFKSILFIGTIYFYFRGHITPALTWWQFIRSETYYSYQKILEGSWIEITAFVRTILFTCTLWLSAGIVYRAVRINNQGFGVSITTIAYLVLMNITTDLDVKWALIRVTVYSLLLLSLLQMRLVGKEHQIKWMSIAMSLILLITSIAYTIPKPKEAASQILRFLPGGVSSYKKVGYDTSDHKLGGPFEEDNTVVFYAQTTSKQYWRGESRSVYTGSEWHSAGEEQRTLPLGTYIGLDTPANTSKKLEYKAKVTFTDPKLNVLFYDGFPKEITDIGPKPLALYTTGNQDIKAKYDNNRYLKEYQIKEDIPVVNDDTLRLTDKDYPADIKKEYLQLPFTLPARVGTLAGKIVENKKNPYDQALAIQEYLKTGGGYAYERMDVPYLLPGQDFVDQFLFVSKKGYCEHFASSMVVMLRSIGIPARYVKGFATGDVNIKSSNLTEVTMRNKNAHAWVEAYFNGSGWVSFEPTPGFTHPEKKDIEEKKAEKQLDTPAASSIPPIAPNQLERLKDNDSNVTAQSYSSIRWNRWISGALLLAAMVFWRKRKQIAIWFLLERTKRAKANQSLFAVYLSLLKILGKLFSRRKQGETIREFVERLPIHSDSKGDLRKLTANYERYVYGGYEVNVEESKILLQRLVRYFLS